MKVIPAKFPGRCPLCGLGISVGQPISPWGVKWGHEHCVAKQGAAPSAAPYKPAPPPRKPKYRPYTAPAPPDWEPDEPEPESEEAEPWGELPPPEPPKPEPPKPPKRPPSIPADLKAFADDPMRVGRGRLSYVCLTVLKLFESRGPLDGDTKEQMLPFCCPPAAVDAEEAAFYEKFLSKGLGKGEPEHDQVGQYAAKQFDTRWEHYREDWHKRRSRSGHEKAEERRKAATAVMTAAEAAPSEKQEIKDELVRLFGPEGVVRLSSRGKKKFCMVCRKPVEYGADVYITLSGKHVAHEKCGKEEAKRLIAERKAKQDWKTPQEREEEARRKAKAELDALLAELEKKRAKENTMKRYYSSTGVQEIMEAMYRPMEPARNEGMAEDNPPIVVEKGPFTPQMLPYYVPSTRWGDPEEAKSNPGRRGGFSGSERSSLPSWYFLKPGERGWPAGDPRRGAPDVAHAELVIQYMTRGFGNRSEYPSLLRELAKRYPPSDRRWSSIWSKYDRLKGSIEEKRRTPRATRSYAEANPEIDTERIGAEMLGLVQAAREGDQWAAYELELVKLQAVIDMHETVIEQIEAGMIPKRYYAETRAKLAEMYTMLGQIRAAQSKVPPTPWKAAANPRRRR